VEDRNPALPSGRVGKEVGDRIVEGKSMLRAQAQQRRRCESLCHRADVELAGQGERLSDCGRVCLLEKDDAVLRYENDPGEPAVGLRARNRIETRATLRRRWSRTCRGREQEEQRPDQGTRASAVRIAEVNTDLA
jgi:hypothetical protein